MIQIIGLRSFVDEAGKKKSYDKPFPIHTEIKSVKDLFDNLDIIIAQIPEKERWNMFYTVANCKAGKREFDFSGTIPFDIDHTSEKYLDSYVSVICTALGVDMTKVGVVSSGNGLHVLVALKKPIDKKEYYKENRAHYKGLCGKINKALEAAGLPGEADPAVFEPRRILRLPGTVNRKPDKPEKLCTLVQKIRGPQEINMELISGIPAVKKDDQLSPDIIRKYPNVDPPAVMAGCSYLVHCKENPNDISEPQWYAALSITARLNDKTTKDGYEWSHELSQGYKGYDPNETDEKIAQALESSGPRTCESIASLWGGCKKCPNFQKVSSPILIRGADCIPTESTGFHNIDWTGKAKPTPNYKDLRQFFEREHPYKGLDGSGIVQVWNGKNYETYDKLYLDQFAQANFNPYAKDNMRREFANLVRSTNLKPMAWWDSSIRRKINFQNGYLDIDSMEFRPHDKDLGFRYVLPYDYDENAKAPVFEKMMAMVTGGDRDAQNVLLEYMGYALSNDDCWAQKALLLTGDGANGKSTWIGVLNKLAGDGNYASLNLDGLNKSEYSRQLLDGKLFNVSEETPTKALLDSSLFKSLATGGEIQVRSPYKEPYFIKNRAKLIFTCNELPGSSDNSYGFYRRLIIVPFDQKFTKDTAGYDPHIADKLDSELAGIFNLAIAGYHRLAKAKAFTECKKVQDTLDEYQYENDTVLYWAREALVVYTNGGFGDHFAPIRDLYESYKFDTESQSRRPVTLQKFSKSLSRLRPEIWEGIPYEERYVRETVERGDEKARIRGLRGVGYQSFS